METISSKQTELDTFIAEGYKTALSEERRRYCFLVDRQCAVAKNSSAYHGKVSFRQILGHILIRGIDHKLSSLKSPVVREFGD